MISKRKVWPIKSVFVVTTQPIVLLLGFASFFRVNSLSNIINLRTRQVLFKNHNFRNKPLFPIKERESCLFFWADLNFL